LIKYIELFTINDTDIKKTKSRTGMNTERLSATNFFYYMNHPHSEDLDARDHTKCLVRSIALGIFTGGFFHLISFLYYSRFCKCCRVKSSPKTTTTPPNIVQKPNFRRDGANDSSDDKTVKASGIHLSSTNVVVKPNAKQDLTF